MKGNLISQTLILLVVLGFANSSITGKNDESNMFELSPNEKLPTTFDRMSTTLKRYVPLLRDEG